MSVGLMTWSHVLRKLFKCVFPARAGVRTHDAIRQSAYCPPTQHACTPDNGSSDFKGAVKRSDLDLGVDNSD